LIEVELSVGECWAATECDWEDLARQAVLAAVAATPHGALVAHPAVAEVSVCLSRDDDVQALNARYRGKDAPTNVLSFPMFDAGGITLPADASAGEVLLGDIVLARETCLREAEVRGVPLSAHASHLIVHGTLHLLGYDHMSDPEAEQMETLERGIMAALGLHDPYAPTED
jgi:probable rRNA maturation factor